MLDSQENRTTHQDSVEMARESAIREAQEAKTGTADEQQRKKQALVEKVKQELRDAEIPAREYNQAKAYRMQNMYAREGEKALRSVVRAATLAKEGIYVTSKVPAQKLLTDLADTGLTLSTASAIEANLKDYLLGDKDIVFSSNGGPKSQFENAFDILKQTDRLASTIVGEALVNRAQEFGASPESIKQKFEMRSEDEAADEMQQRMYAEDSFEGQWRSLYEKYLQPTDRELVKALFSPVEFIRYVEKKRDKLKAEHGDWDEKKLKRELTSSLEGEVGALFGSIYHRLDTEPPKEFFDKIQQEDYFSGIGRASLDLRQRIHTLGNQMVPYEQRAKQILGDDFSLVKKTTAEPTSETIKLDTGEYLRDEQGNKVLDEQGKPKHRIVEKPRYRLKPLKEEKEVSLSNFIEHLHIQIDNYIQFRQYVHDSRALFFHPPGKEGFYAQMGEFAERFGMVDFDSMMGLPDADIFLKAFHMYDKYLDEQFASQDWKHTPEMFTRKPEEMFTPMELEVLEQLKMLYTNEDISENRLKSALSMAVGASRGIFMNEPEKCAFADSALNADGTGKFNSYYTQDATPLMAFNPVMHFPYRFQMEGANLHPLYFMDFDKTKTGSVWDNWDHEKLWKNMQDFRDTFIAGRGKLEGKNLFIDFCNNIGKVGGPFQRKGWRTGSMFETYFQYTDENKSIIKVLDSWKEIENIGYEALHDFVNHNRMGDNFLKSAKTKAERTDFFKYLYEKYYGKDVSGLDDYLEAIRKQAKTTVINDIVKKNIWTNNINEEIELETSKIFMFRALSRVLAQRIPTKFIRIDRDRYQNDGNSRWKIIMKAMGYTSDSQFSEFDKVMKDFLLVESALRQEISTQMKDGLKAGKHNLRGIDGIDYKLNPDKIAKYLKDRNLSDDRINKVLELFRHLQDKYSDNDRFLDAFATEIKDGEFKYTFAIEETDLTFVPFEAGGPRLLPRAIKDIATTEQVLSQVMIQWPKMLHKVATDGKGDYSEIVGAIQKAKESISGIIGPDYAAEVAYRMAAMAISYFKKDSIAKPLFGMFGSGRINSLAGRIAGRSTGVMEWDAREIDRFIIALETADILKKEPYAWWVSKREKVPQYIKIPGLNISSRKITIPFLNKVINTPEINGLIKLPDIFNIRKPDMKWTSDNLRKDFGASGKHITLELINSVFPVLLAFLLYQYFKKALEDLMGGGKK
ncbi:MAG: hypothetical protein US11_C0006G0022 [Candidatus Roizmanbacteria bacterium GW2011_GWA2_36_23]|uniref:Uncharacterized protein n=1 Tax=Candidatus Roizmanbacteria bacterium GW2011_GWA2_36_23 TaxID=1618480 RepID=A0A0G0EKK4_9BACT|nr:MAG: hypothetical protein US11_C0006G0022 [Candidatus Roizmanbacteria bacterium GW2011_GWA2_36_23]